MRVAKTMGDQYREARLAAAQGNQSLATLAGAAEVLGVSAYETVGRWERDEATPSNFNVKRMAIEYRAPELTVNYCATSCPLGQGRMREVHLTPLERMAIRLHNMHSGLADDVDLLMRIAEDGVIEEDEQVQFDAVVDRLMELSHLIGTMKVFADKHRQKHDI